MRFKMIAIFMIGFLFCVNAFADPLIYRKQGSSSQWDDVEDGINYAGGNVGIGTTTPTAKLDVVATTEETLGEEIVQNGNFTGDADGWILENGWSYNDNNVIFSLEMGSEEITNGDFSGGMTDWVGSGWSVSGGSAHYTFTQGIGSNSYPLYQVSGGINYQVNDVLTLDGGNSDATITVTEIVEMDSGGIQNWVVTTQGSGYAPESSYNLTGGSGEGATFWNLWQDPLYQEGELVEGGIYTLTATIGGTTGTVTVHLGEGDYTGQEYSAGAGNIEYTNEWHAIDSQKIIFVPSSDFDGTIDNVSVKMIGEEAGVLAQEFSLEEGDYQVSFNIGGTTGEVEYYLGEGAGGVAEAGAGNISEVLNYAGGEGGYIVFFPSNDFNGTIDSVSVKSYSEELGDGLSVTGNVYFNGEEVSTTEHFTKTIVSPSACYEITPQFCITPKTATAITIKNIEVSNNTSSYEVSGNIMYADDFISQSNSSVINAFDTSSGVLSDNSIDNGYVPAGKCIYISFNSQPDENITQTAYDISYKLGGTPPE